MYVHVYYQNNSHHTVTLNNNHDDFQYPTIYETVNEQ